jgi:hypothetical protein
MRWSAWTSSCRASAGKAGPDWDPAGRKRPVRSTRCGASRSSAARRRGRQAVESVRQARDVAHGVDQDFRAQSLAVVPRIVARIGRVARVGRRGEPVTWDERMDRGLLQVQPAAREAGPPARRELDVRRGVRCPEVVDRFHEPDAEDLGPNPVDRGAREVEGCPPRASSPPEPSRGSRPGANGGRRAEKRFRGELDARIGWRTAPETAVKTTSSPPEIGGERLAPL